MCGFVALIERRGAPASPATVASMLRVITHRGPDDEGFYANAGVAFGFRRLAILDISSAGHQPMSSADGMVTIVFNGEIYNFIELHRELAALGHRFQSKTDTEVLLRSYLQWGKDCVRRLEGMWAFIIHDRRTNCVFGSRDRFGMKPLFCFETPERFLFASEIKSIRASGLYRPETDLAVCAKFLYECLLDDTDATFYKGIRSIPAAHAFTIDASGRFQSERYWDLPTEPERYPDPATEFADLFERSVAMHMRSDVPLGVNLSGGLDSTAILCAIARHRKAAGNTQALKTFCFTAPEFDESAYIAATLDQTGAEQYRIGATPIELWDSLSEVLWFQDEPVHSLTAVVGFHLSKLAAEQGVKVVVNGQGADEVLAGYDGYFRDYWYTQVRQGHPLIALREIKAFTAQHGGSVAALALDLSRHFIQTGLRRSAAYRRLSMLKHKRSLAGNDWFAPELVDALPDDSLYEAGDLDTVLTHSVTAAPLPLYLRVEDRNSMAHSIEARLPFLDPKIVEFAFRLMPSFKIRGPWNKYLLREAMTGRIPEVVRTRPDKMGFPTPVSKWLRTDLFDLANGALDQLQSAASGLIRTDAVRRDLARHRRGEIDVANKMFNVIQLAIWQSTILSSSGQPAP